MNSEHNSERGLRWAQNRVRDFQVAAGQPVRDAPYMLDVARVSLRERWMRDELEEFLQAASVVDQADAMIDLIYFALGTLVESGIDAETVFQIVHDANMNKLTQGSRVSGSDGKVEKPSDWISPESLIEAALAKRATGLELRTGNTSSTAIAALVSTLLVQSEVDFPSDREEALLRRAKDSQYWSSPREALECVDEAIDFREIPSTLLSELDFHAVLDRELMLTGCIGVTFDPAIAYGTDDPPYLESASITRRHDSELMILDHGPSAPGLRTVNIDRFLQAVRSASGSLWVVNCAEPA